MHIQLHEALTVNESEGSYEAQNRDTLLEGAELLMLSTLLGEVTVLSSLGTTLETMSPNRTNINGITNCQITACQKRME